MAYPVARFSFLPFVKLFAKTIEGIDNIPADKPVIVAANHLGLFDPLFLGAIFITKTKRKLRFLVDTRSLFWHIIGYVLQHWTNTIPVRPGRGTTAVDLAVAAILQRDSIGLFPEGKVNTSPTLLSGRTGAVRISLLSRAPLLPVGIENTDVRLLTIIGRRFINRREGIAIRFGEPYHPHGDPNDAEVVRVLTDSLMERIGELSGKTYYS